MTWAEKAFKLAQPVGDTDKPLSAHLEQARKTYEKLGIEFEVTDDTNPGLLPPGFSFIWETFVDLSSGRQVGFVPCPIAYSDIDSWCRLNRVRLNVWEIDVIKRVDSLWLKVSNEHRPKNTKGE